MARHFKVWQGEDLDPEYDLTEPTSDVHVIWEEIEAGGRAFRGESDTGNIPLRDERGETGDDVNLPGGLTRTSLSRGSRWEWMENVGDPDETRMAGGRIGTKDYSRVRQKADRAREVLGNWGDPNEDLDDLIVDNWVRSEEWDYERVEALRTDYLNGTPRATTVIAGTYISTGNGVLLPERTYDGMTPKEVIAEIAQVANKEFFVTIDYELWYDVATSTSYMAGLRISDRLDELNDTGTCEDAEQQFLGAACDHSGDNFLSDYAPWSGDREERVEMQVAAGVAAGDTIIVLASFCQTFTDDLEQVYDEQGNTWTRDAEHENTGSSTDDTIQFWRCNVTNPLATGDYIRFAFNFSSSLVPTVESSGRCIAAYVFPGTLDNPTVGAGAGTFSATANVNTPAGDVVIAAAVSSNAAGTLGVTPDADWDDLVPYTSIGGSGNLNTGVIGQHLLAAGASTYTVGFSASTDWAAIAVAYDSTDGGGEGLPTFDPKWRTGPSSSENGLELVHKVRLYWGSEGEYVEAEDTDTAAAYWYSERSFHTSDPSITDATKAQVLAESILFRLRLEDRTYNVTIGPLNSDQISCVKYGQLINIKARAIPDADDGFVLRRIAQLRWTTPRPGMFYAHMQLGRPVKDLPYGVGPKETTKEVTKHTLTGSHPAANITVQDSGGNFTGTDVEAVLAELAGGSGIAHPVTDHGTMGATETFDFTDGTDHEGVLDQNLTVTLTGATTGEAAWMTLVLTQDGTGTNTINLPASVVNGSDVESAFDTTANAVNVISVFTYDGGTTWYAFLAGGSGGASALDDLTDVVITSATLDDDLRFDGSNWVNDARKWEAVTDGEDVFVWDGDDLVHEWNA